jgi:hypothetical protein
VKLSFLPRKTAPHVAHFFAEAASNHRLRSAEQPSAGILSQLFLRAILLGLTPIRLLLNYVRYSQYSSLTDGDRAVSLDP